MNRAGRAGVTLAAALAAAAGAATAGVHRAGPPPAHTGAFGEPDCGACHFDAIRDDDAGAVALTAPAAYRPGQAYRLKVELRHPDLPAGGFQLSARFLEGDAAGMQAGTVAAVGERTRVERGGDGVLYASHSERGVIADEPGTMTWELDWTAPAGRGPVAFDVAAQVASDDDSEFGERLYVHRHTARPAVEKERRD